MDAWDSSPVSRYSSSRSLAAQGHGLVVGIGQIGKAVAQIAAQLGEDLLSGGAREVGFVDEYKGGDLSRPQQPPQGQGVALDAGGRADDQNGAVQHIQRPLHLRGEIHMPRGVQQGGVEVVGQVKGGLLGEDGDAPLPFQCEGIEKGVAVIHPPKGADGAGDIQHGLRKSRFSGVHMGQNADDGTFHKIVPSGRVFYQYSRKNGRNPQQIPCGPCRESKK